MALDSGKFDTELNNHPIFTHFYDNVSSKATENSHCRRIFEIKHDLFYLCDKYSGDIFITRTLSFTENNEDPIYQVYTANARMKGAVCDVKVSERSDLLAIFTSEGLYVGHLPHVRTRCMLRHVPYDNNYSLWHVFPKDHLMHSLFVYEALQAQWHPKQENHLYVLFNDNYLRLYDAFYQTQLNIISLGCHPIYRFSTAYALEEGAIDFDFLPPDDDDVMDRLLLVTRTDGTIFKVLLTPLKCFKFDPIDFEMISNNCSDKLSIFGFVHSMVVLSSKPVTVIFTYNNNVYHCILLDCTDKEVLLPFEHYELSCFGESDVLHPHDVTLRLFKDPSCCHRYFILHGYGLHAVMMSTVCLLNRAVTSSSDIGGALSNRGKMFLGSSVSASNIVHLVAPSPSCPLRPGKRALLGLAVLPGRLHQNTLVIMDPEGCVLTTNIDEVVPPPPDSLQGVASSIQGQNFFEQINAVLNPPEKKHKLLKYEGMKMIAKIYGKSGNNTSDQVPEALRKFNNQLKEVDIGVQEQAIACIKSKCDELKRNEYFQTLQLVELKECRDDLKSNAERIAEKYEEINDKLTLQHKRFDALNLRIQAPIRSMADEKLKKDIVHLTEKYRCLQKAIDQARETLDYFISRQSTQVQTSRTVHLPDGPKKHLYKDLSVMNDQIRNLKQRIDPLLKCVDFTQSDLFLQ